MTFLVNMFCRLDKFNGSIFVGGIYMEELIFRMLTAYLRDVYLGVY